MQKNAPTTWRQAKKASFDSNDSFCASGVDSCGSCFSMGSKLDSDISGQDPISLFQSGR